MSESKAVVVNGFGGANELTMTTVDRPSAGPSELVVATAGAGLNPVDWKTRAGGGISGMVPGFPFVLGWDVSGTVAEVGPGVVDFAVGDPVYGMANFPLPAGAYAEHVLAPAVHFAKAPTGIGLVEAGAVPLAALTAWQALFDFGRIEAGTRVLVHAAAGGVGHFAVQLAAWAGAEVVGTASARNHEWLRELGCSEVVDYTAGDFAEKTGEVDLVVDGVGGEVFDRSLDVLRPGGAIVTLPSPGDFGPARERGFRADWVFVHPDRHQLERIAALIDEGRVAPHIERVFAFDEVADAHRLGEQGHVRGKLLLDLTR